MELSGIDNHVHCSRDEGLQARVVGVVNAIREADWARTVCGGHASRLLRRVVVSKILLIWRKKNKLWKETWVKKICFERRFQRHHTYAFRMSGALGKHPGLLASRRAASNVSLSPAPYKYQHHKTINQNQKRKFLQSRKGKQDHWSTWIGVFQSVDDLQSLLLRKILEKHASVFVLRAFETSSSVAKVHFFKI